MRVGAFEMAISVRSDIRASVASPIGGRRVRQEGDVPSHIFLTANRARATRLFVVPVEQ